MSAKKCRQMSALLSANEYSRAPNYMSAKEQSSKSKFFDGPPRVVFFCKGVDEAFLRAFCNRNLITHAYVIWWFIYSWMNHECAFCKRTVMHMWLDDSFMNEWIMNVHSAIGILITDAYVIWWFIHSRMNHEFAFCNRKFDNSCICDLMIHKWMNHEFAFCNSKFDNWCICDLMIHSRMNHECAFCDSKFAHITGFTHEKLLLCGYFFLWPRSSWWILHSAIGNLPISPALPVKNCSCAHICFFFGQGVRDEYCILQ